MTVFEYAIIREAQKVERYPTYRPRGWERLLEIAEEIQKRDAAADRTPETPRAKKASR